jgi:hypothetical protein
MDAMVRETSATGADGEDVWSRHPDADAKLAMNGDFGLAAETPASRGRRGQESPVPEESTE